MRSFYNKWGIKLVMQSKINELQDLVSLSNSHRSVFIYDIEDVPIQSFCRFLCCPSISLCLFLPSSQRNSCTYPSSSLSSSCNSSSRWLMLWEPLPSRKLRWAKQEVVMNSDSFPVWILEPRERTRGVKSNTQGQLWSSMNTNPASHISKIAY